MNIDQIKKRLHDLLGGVEQAASRFVAPQRPQAQPTRQQPSLIDTAGNYVRNFVKNNVEFNPSPSIYQQGIGPFQIKQNVPSDISVPKFNIKNPVGNFIANIPSVLAEGFINAPIHGMAGSQGFNQNIRDVVAGKSVRPQDVAANIAKQAELPAYLLSGGGEAAAAKVAAPTFKAAVVNGAIKLLPYGVGFGAISGAETGQKIDNPTEYVKNFLKQEIVSSAGAAILGGATGGISFGLDKVLKSGQITPEQYVVAKAQELGPDKLNKYESKLLETIPEKEQTKILSGMSQKYFKVSEPPKTPQTTDLNDAVNSGQITPDEAKAMNPDFQMAQPPAQAGINNNNIAIKTPEQPQVQILPEGKQKKFLQTVQKSPETSPELAKGVGEVQPQTYTIEANKPIQQAADQAIAKDSDAVAKRVLSNEPPNNEKIIYGIQLAKKYQAEKNYDASIEIITKMDSDLRAAGRTVQAASLWNNLGPEGVLRAANKVAESHNQELSKDVQKTILTRMNEIQALPEEQRGPEMLKVLNYVAENIPASKLEKAQTWLDSYRYENMLSGLGTHERNIYQNLFNTYITRPADIGLEAGYDFLKHPFNPMARDMAFSDVPRYYKNLSVALPDSIMAAKEAFKNGVWGQMDYGTGTGAIERARESQMTPAALKITGGALEAQDKFFSTLISAGEYNRLLKNGVAEDVAKAQASKLAEDYLVRSPLGKTTAADPAFVRALDWLGYGALEMGKFPVVGKPFRWFAPFIRTPIDVGKMMIAHSPLGFIGGSYSNKQLAAATGGAIVSAVGGVLAMQGRTTWSAPTSEKEKSYFYATGRKPFSVQIGNTWVPMFYFGPYALSIAIPAAMKHYQDESKTALTDDAISKTTRALTDLSSFIASQSSLQGIGGFFRFLDGDQNISAGSLAGSMAGQLIPAGGLIRWVNKFVDNAYRKGGDFSSSILKDIPILSKNLPAYTTPTGEVEKRIPINAFLPYEVGIANPTFENLYKLQQKAGQQSAIVNKTVKDLTDKFSLQFQQQGTQQQGPAVNPEKKLSDLEKEAAISAAKPQVELSGTPIAIGDSTLVYKDEVSGNVVVKSLDEILSPKTGIDQFKQQEQKYSFARQVYATQGIPDDKKLAWYKKLGITAEDVAYDYPASQTNEVKSNFLINEFQSMPHDQVINVLTAYRVPSVSGNIYASDTVLKNLFDNGIINNAEYQGLKKLDFNKKGQLLSGGSGGKKLAVKKFNVAAPKKAATVKFTTPAYKPIQLKKAGSTAKKININKPTGYNPESIFKAA